MKLKKNDICELQIEKMAYGGKGIARVDGLVIFVKGGVPGDRLTAKVFKKKKDFAEAGIIEILTPSPDRITAPCPYAGYCGGCQWQHVRYETQLKYKKAHVEESMRHIGDFQDVAVREPIPSKGRFAYRNKMEFSFSDRRWFLPHEMDENATERGFALGLHVPGTFSKVIDITACLLQREEGNVILRQVKHFARNSNLPVYGLKSHEGFWRFLVIRYSAAFDQWMVNLVTSEDRSDMIRPLAEDLIRKNSRIKSVINNITGRKAAIAVGEQEVVLAGQDHIEDTIGPYIFQISANSFFQTNSVGAEILYETVAEFAELQGDETVLDLYSGTGTIPIFLASGVRSVTGVEISGSAVRDARKNCKKNAIQNCRFLCGDIRQTLPDLALEPDVLIIDPPRAGMHQDVLNHVLRLSPKRVIYVSCNPATLARDLSRMRSDYGLIEIQPVDMFPHTYHIETVAKLHHL